MGISLVLLIFGAGMWYSYSFRWQPAVAHALGGSAISFLASAFLIIFASDQVSFFGISILFLSLNYLFVLELSFRHEDTSRITAMELLRERISTHLQQANVHFDTKTALIDLK